MNEPNSLLKEKHYQQAARNLFLNQEFFTIVDAFYKQGISLIPLKGIALIQNIYRDIDARYIGDIDFLIKPGDVPLAAIILKGLGYAGSTSLFNPRRPYSIYLNSAVFWKTTKIQYYVHLHWHILNTTFPLFMYTIDMSEIYRQAKREKRNGKDLLMMAAPHLIVYLSMHAFNHSFNTMSLFFDIQRAIEFYRDNFYWQEVIDVARSWNAGLALYYSLFFTSKILDVNLPWDLLSILKPTKISRIAEKVNSYVLENKKGSHNLVYPLYLNMAGNIWKKFKFVFLSLFPPPKQLARIYSVKNKYLVFLYYFKRFGWGFTQVKRFLFRLGR